MTTRPDYDVAIIGAGPAGGLAAVRLAEADAKVIILEKETLPRAKACGGALSKGPVGRLLDWNYDDVIAARCTSVRYLLDYQREVRIERDTPILFVNRDAFDWHLIERALALSPSTVSLVQNCTIKMIEQTPDFVRLESREGHVITARYVIGADGATGPSRRAINQPRSVRMAPAIDAEIQTGEMKNDSYSHCVTFNFACASGGYGWSFPKNDHVSHGVGSWDRSAKIRLDMETYINWSVGSDAITSRIDRGHPIPLYKDHECLSKGRILLAGDAANLVDPYLGEGIRYALQSGDIAAKYILRGLEEGPQALRHYSAEIHAQIGNRLKRVAQTIQPLMVHAPDIFYKTFIEAGGSMAAFTATLSTMLEGGASQSHPYEPPYGGD